MSCLEQALELCYGTTTRHTVELYIYRAFTIRETSWVMLQNSPTMPYRVELYIQCNHCGNGWIRNVGATSVGEHQKAESLKHLLAKKQE